MNFIKGKTFAVSLAPNFSFAKKSICLDTHLKEELTDSESCEGIPTPKSRENSRKKMVNILLIANITSYAICKR